MTAAVLAGSATPGAATVTVEATLPSEIVMRAEVVLPSVLAALPSALDCFDDAVDAAAQAVKTMARREAAIVVGGGPL